jgi:hypothetical protein
MRAKKMKYLVIAVFLLASVSSGVAQSASASNNIQSTLSNNMKKFLRQMDKEFANMRKIKGGNFKQECAAGGCTRLCPTGKSCTCSTSGASCSCSDCQ